MSRGVGQRIDDLQLLDGRARPAVGDDERHGIFMSRPDVNEVDIQPVDLGDELGMRVQLRLAPPPVVIGRPIPRERLNEGELHALRKVRDGFLLRDRVAAMRLRNSIRSASGASKRNGRIAVLSVVCSVRRSVTVAGVMLPSFSST